MHVDFLASYATILKFVLYQNSIVKSEHIITQASTSFFYGWIKNQNYKDVEGGNFMDEML